MRKSVIYQTIWQEGKQEGLQEGLKQVDRFKRSLPSSQTDLEKNAIARIFVSL